MNRLLVRADELDGDGKVRLLGRRARHLLDVLGVQVGQSLKAGVLDEGRATAEVLQVEGDAVLVRLEPRFLETPTLSTGLILALPRPKALRRLLQDVASFAVARLDLINAWKVSSSYFGSPLLDPERLLEELTLGAEQGSHWTLPKVELHRLFVPFVESLGLSAPESLRLLAHPDAECYLEEVELASFGSSVTLAVGPEGGWIDAEMESLVDQGFVPVKLGDAILRTEVAVTTGLAQVELMGRRASREFDSQS